MDVACARFIFRMVSKMFPEMSSLALAMAAWELHYVNEFFIRTICRTCIYSLSLGGIHGPLKRTLLQAKKTEDSLR